MNAHAGLYNKRQHLRFMALIYHGIVRIASGSVGV